MLTATGKLAKGRAQNLREGARDVETCVTLLPCHRRASPPPRKRRGRSAVGVGPRAAAGRAQREAGAPRLPQPCGAEIQGVGIRI
jgi:hypothetical protein